MIRDGSFVLLAIVILLHSLCCHFTSLSQLLKGDSSIELRSGTNPFLHVVTCSTHPQLRAGSVIELLAGRAFHTFKPRPLYGEQAERSNQNCCWMSFIHPESLSSGVDDDSPQGLIPNSRTHIAIRHRLCVIFVLYFMAKLVKIRVTWHQHQRIM